MKNQPEHKKGALSRGDETIIRMAGRDDPFARIPKDLLNHPQMSFKAKGILCYLLGKPPGWKLRRADLENHGKEGAWAIRSALKEMRKYGYADLVPIRSVVGKVVEWVWKISDSPVFLPDVENQHVGNQHVGNMHLSKKERSDTDCIENSVSKGSKGTENDFSELPDDLFDTTDPEELLSKEERLRALPQPKVRPSRTEFETFVEQEALEGLDYRFSVEDLYDTLTHRKWRHWNTRTHRWDRIRDWRQYLRGLDMAILDAKTNR